MPTRVLLEGPTIEPLLAQVRDEYGSGVKIISADKVRSGGIGGFFAKQHYELSVEVPDPTEDSDDMAQQTVAGNKPNNFERLLEQAESQDRVTTEPGQAPDLRAQREGRAAGLGDTGAAFADLMAGLDVASHPGGGGPPRAAARPRQNETREDTPTVRPFRPSAAGGTAVNRPLPAALPTVPSFPARPGAAAQKETPMPPQPLQPAAAQVSPAPMPAAPMPPTGSPRGMAAPMTSGPMTSASMTSAPMPGMPMTSAPMPHMPEPVAPIRTAMSAQARATAPAPLRTSEPTAVPPRAATAAPFSPAPVRSADEVYGLEETPEPVSPAAPPVAVAPPAPVPALRSGDLDAVQRNLVAVGMPEEMARQITGGDTYAGVLSVLAARPAAPGIPDGPGEILVLAGEVHTAVPIAKMLLEQVHVDQSHLLLAGPSTAGTGLHSSRLISSRGAAESRADKLQNADHSWIVVIDAPVGGTDPFWVNDMCDALGATALWGVVDATRKTADTARHLRGLGDVEALVVHSVELTADPASVLGLDVPIFSLDGKPATPHAWAAMLCARIAAEVMPSAASPRRGTRANRR
ncbi:hypothetical protein [Actinoplanes missouriensis]|uniref:hypothetical protein n=1 Tax=Actinoplanes missouriensis TaxID=1866 RepID=UPI0012FCF87C|nr:hypothetical protein [Actinoplanes missouriensis]